MAEIKYILLGLRAMTFVFLLIAWICIACVAIVGYTAAAFALALIADIFVAAAIVVLLFDATAKLPKPIWLCLFFLIAIFALVTGILMAIAASRLQSFIYFFNVGPAVSTAAAATTFAFFAFLTAVADIFIVARGLTPNENSTNMLPQPPSYCVATSSTTIHTKY